MLSSMNNEKQVYIWGVSIYKGGKKKATLNTDKEFHIEKNSIFE